LISKLEDKDLVGFVSLFWAEFSEAKVEIANPIQFKDQEMKEGNRKLKFIKSTESRSVPSIRQVYAEQPTL